VKPSSDGLWRKGRGTSPLEPPPRSSLDLGHTRAGNRFDSATGNYSVLYLGSSPDVCFGETLNRYRVNSTLAFIDDEWETLGFMPRYTVPRDWRDRRTIVIQETPEGDAISAGIRCASRTNPEWECWAVFEDTPINELERRPITMTHPDLTAVATRYGLIVF
jgi:hypothetical protein